MSLTNSSRVYLSLTSFVSHFPHSTTPNTQYLPQYNQPISLLHFYFVTQRHQTYGYITFYMVLISPFAVYKVSFLRISLNFPVPIVYRIAFEYFNL